MMKPRIGLFCIGALAFGIAMFGNAGTAEAAPHDLLSGITRLTEKAAGDTLGQTIGTIADVPEAVASDLAQAAPESSIVGEVANGTAELLGQVGDTADTAIDAVVQVVLEPLHLVTSGVDVPSPVPSSPTAEEALPAQATPPPEDKQASSSVTLHASAPATSSAPELPSQAGPKPESKPAPAISLSHENGLPATPEDEAPAKNEGAPRFVGNPRAITLGSKSANKPSAGNESVKSNKSPARNAEPSSRRSNAIPDAVTNASVGPQSPPSSGHGGFFHPRLADAVLTETLFLQLRGRRNYAKNSKLLITKRGNEPPTPPPKSSFFSREIESVRKRSGAFVIRNRNAAPIAGRSGRSIRDAQSLCHRKVPVAR
ncbi:hypothetical protein [Cohnella silvisoli]|uniref:Uncharacterized protein n=1 Tax=Cohnella silvisoli TaxID=2873699 RepID=A0ABV1KQK7_9BACL|nr:hypothetical protein [Cohnella silvisoli]MCD9024655.1 hypothetical protein [Cohnella silvisoli]